MLWPEAKAPLVFDFQQFETDVSICVFLKLVEFFGCTGQRFLVNLRRFQPLCPHIINLPLFFTFFWYSHYVYCGTLNVALHFSAALHFFHFCPLSFPWISINVLVSLLILSSNSLNLLLSPSNYSVTYNCRISTCVFGISSLQILYLIWVVTVPSFPSLIKVSFYSFNIFTMATSSLFLLNPTLITLMRNFLFSVFFQYISHTFGGAGVFTCLFYMSCNFLLETQYFT